MEIVSIDSVCCIRTSRLVRRLRIVTTAGVLGMTTLCSRMVAEQTHAYSRINAKAAPTITAMMVTPVMLETLGRDGVCTPGSDKLLLQNILRILALCSQPTLAQAHLLHADMNAAFVFQRFHHTETIFQPCLFALVACTRSHARIQNALPNTADMDSNHN